MEDAPLRLLPARMWTDKNTGAKYRMKFVREDIRTRFLSSGLRLGCWSRYVKCGLIVGQSSGPLSALSFRVAGFKKLGRIQEKKNQDIPLLFALPARAFEWVEGFTPPCLTNIFGFKVFPGFPFDWWVGFVAEPWFCTSSNGFLPGREEEDSWRGRFCPLTMRENHAKHTKLSLHL